MVSMILCFLVIYQIFNGPIIWLYLSEVAVDSALGICFLTLWGSMMLLTLATPYLMDFLNPYGVFLLFGSMCMVGGVFCQFMVRETHGLIDKEKKIVYSPRHLKEKIQFK